MYFVRKSREDFAAPRLRVSPTFEFHARGLHIWGASDSVSVHRENEIVYFAIGHFRLSGRAPSCRERAKIWSQAYRQGLARELEGYFLCGVFDEISGGLELLTDEFGLCAPMIVGSLEEGSAAISNDFMALAGEGACSLDPEAIGQYAHFGRVIEGRTFAREIRFLGPQRAGLEPVKRAKPDGPDEAARILKETLRLNTRELISSFQVEKMLLSGGADSRVLLSVLENPGALEFVTYISRNPASPRDAEIAAQLAAQLKAKHTIVDANKEAGAQNPDMSAALSYGALSEPHLTGLFGSELVGDAWYKILPRAPRDLWTSFASSTYSGVGGFQFIFPYLNPFLNRISPFWDSDVVRLLLSTDPNHLFDYTLYNRLMNREMEELLSVPLHSNMHRYIGGLPGHEWSPTATPYRFEAGDWLASHGYQTNEAALDLKTRVADLRVMIQALDTRIGKSSFQLGLDRVLKELGIERSPDVRSP
jgi:hypothetical protein